MIRVLSEGAAVRSPAGRKFLDAPRLVCIVDQDWVVQGEEGRRAKCAACNVIALCFIHGRKRTSYVSAPDLLIPSEAGNCDRKVRILVKFQAKFQEL